MQRMRIVISTGGRNLPEMFAYFFISQFASVLGVPSKEFVLKAEGPVAIATPSEAQDKLPEESFPLLRKWRIQNEPLLNAGGGKKGFCGWR